MAGALTGAAFGVVLTRLGKIATGLHRPRR
jgi:hypothetical protein